MNATYKDGNLELVMNEGKYGGMTLDAHNISLQKDHAVQHLFEKLKITFAAAIGAMEHGQIEFVLGVTPDVQTIDASNDLFRTSATLVNNELIINTRTRNVTGVTTLTHELHKLLQECKVIVMGDV
jgi:hypothetical protein